MRGVKNTKLDTIAIRSPITMNMSRVGLASHSTQYNTGHFEKSTSNCRFNNLLKSLHAL